MKRIMQKGLLILAGLMVTGCAQPGWMAWSRASREAAPIAQLDGKAEQDAKARPRSSARLAESSPTHKPTPFSSQPGTDVAKKGEPATSSEAAQNADALARRSAAAPASRRGKKPPQTPAIASANTPHGLSSQHSAQTSSGTKYPPGSISSRTSQGAAQTSSHQRPRAAYADSASPPPPSAGFTPSIAERGLQNAGVLRDEKQTTAAARKPTATKQPSLHESPEVVQTSGEREDDLPEWARDSGPNTSAVENRFTKARHLDLGIANSTTAQPQKARENPQSSVFEPTIPSLSPHAGLSTDELLQLLVSTDEDVVKLSLQQLAVRTSQAAQIEPAILPLLSRQGGLSVHAAWTLLRLQPGHTAARETLVQALGSQEAGVRALAAHVLAERGEEVSAALPLLTQALHDEDGFVRLHVAEALIHHPQWSESALEALLSCLKDRDPSVRWLATYSLAELAPENDRVVAPLIAALQDEQVKVRIGAAYALGELGALARPAVPALQQAQQDAPHELRMAIDHALRLIPTE
ncbi:MAG: hypothetical protein KatS3mg114_1192 [Planctomycetaceae bacterium]|nr:MAG: hypothetical protein KatS3mg114_1192 [Planctomycetaceae bacterium]